VAALVVASAWLALVFSARRPATDEARPRVILEFRADPAAEFGRLRLVLKNTGQRTARDIAVSVTQDALTLRAPRAADGREGKPLPGEIVRVSSLFREPVPSLPAMAEEEFGFVVLSMQAVKVPQTVVYSVTYSDDAGRRYREDELTVNCLAPAQPAP
jgi:hypothetical protein